MTELSLSRSEDPGALATLPLFAGLSEEDLEFCRSALSRRAAAAGETLLTPADPGSGLFVVCTGAVQLYRVAAEGRRLVLADLGPGDVFGWTMFGPQSRRTFARAACDAELYVIDEPGLAELLEEHPAS